MVLFSRSRILRWQEMEQDALDTEEGPAGSHCLKLLDADFTIKRCDEARCRGAAPRPELTGLLVELRKDIMLLRNRDEEDKLTRGAGAAFAKHRGGGGGLP